MREAAEGASLALSIRCFGFGKSSLQSQLFVWIRLLILLESQKKSQINTP
jgi:hypothetical protein